VYVGGGLRAIRRNLWIALLIAVVYNGWVFWNRRGGWSGSHQYTTPDSGISVPTELGGAVKIVQFYARDGVVTEGSGTVLCYSVMNARAVKLDPPAGDVWPSPNRCIDIRPERETRYTLTAIGHDGARVSQSFSVQVAPDEATLPKITYFKIASCKKDYLGEPIFKLRFADQNAEEVSVDPKVLPTLHGSPYGEFYVSPGKATTYTLSVTGKYGHVARQQLTVEAVQCK